MTFARFIARFIDCGNKAEIRCELECGVISPTEECTTQCTDGYICRCDRGFILKDGECVSIDECPKGEKYILCSYMVLISLKKVSKALQDSTSI